jgi:hypothetical protein
MTTAQFLADLTARGVSVDVEDGDLLVDGPRDALDTETITELRRRKSEILSLRRPAGLLVLVPHEHDCRCGRHFKCTAPSCAGKRIRCVCCKLRMIGRRHAERGSHS